MNLFIFNFRIMRKFILISLLLLIAVGGLFLFILTRVNGYIDTHYLKVSSPRQSNLILGTSRAAVGIDPDVLFKYTSSNYYNFSFSVAESSFGPSYFELIKKKVNIKDSNQTFILTVDPWSICSESKFPNNVDYFRENELSLHNLYRVDVNPNVQYLLRKFSGRYTDIIAKKLSNDSILNLHENGWLEISLSFNSERLEQERADQYKNYSKKTSRLFSSLRLNYLLETVKYLKQFGKVYIVRLPVHELMLDLELELMPDFESKINDVKIASDGYFNMNELNGNFQYIDIHHIHKSSVQDVSKLIAKFIINKTDL